MPIYLPAYPFTLYLFPLTIFEWLRGHPDTADNGYSDACHTHCYGCANLHTDPDQYHCLVPAYRQTASHDHTYTIYGAG